MAKLDSSRSLPPGRLSPADSSHGLMDQWSMSGLSHGLSRRYLLWFLALPSWVAASTMFDMMGGVVEVVLCDGMDGVGWCVRVRQKCGRG